MTYQVCGCVCVCGGYPLHHEEVPSILSTALTDAVLTAAALQENIR